MMRALVVATFVVVVGCGGNGATTPDVAGPSPATTSGATSSTPTTGATTATTASTATTIAATMAGAPTTASSTTAATTAAPTTTDAPTTTIDARARARDAFVVMEAEHEAGFEFIDAKWQTVTPEGTGIPWESEPAWCDEAAVIDEKWASDLVGFAWPAELQAGANELILALTVRAGTFHDCAGLGGTYFDQSPNFRRLDAAYLAYNDARDNLRSDLGLPPVEYAR